MGKNIPSLNSLKKLFRKRISKVLPSVVLKPYRSSSTMLITVTIYIKTLVQSMLARVFLILLTGLCFEKLTFGGKHLSRQAYLC